MSAAKTSVLPNPLVKQLNKNGGKDNRNKLDINQKPAGKTLAKNTSGKEAPKSGAPIFKNVFKPSINLGGSPLQSDPSAKPGSPTKSGSSGSPNININLILNLLCKKLKGKGAAQPASATSNTSPAATTTGKQAATKQTGQSPMLNLLNGADKKFAENNDITAKGQDGKPMYLIANGKDDKPRLFKQSRRQPGKYKTVSRDANGQKQRLQLGQNPNIQTDQHGVSTVKTTPKNTQPTFGANNDGGNSISFKLA